MKTEYHLRGADRPSALQLPPEQSLSSIGKQYPFKKTAFAVSRLLVSLTLALLFVAATNQFASAQSIGDSFTVQYAPYGGLADFGSSSIGRGFCTDYNKHAPSGGFGYTVVSGSNTGLSTYTRNKVTASLQALSDGFSEQSVTSAIWHFTNGKNYYGSAATIVNRVNNGTYQPQPAVWLLPFSGHLQPMVAPLTNPPTPTPAPTATPTPPLQNTCTTEIVSVHSNKCLDVHYGSYSNGANIVQWSCSGGNNQRFAIEQSSGGSDVFNIRAKHSGKAVDVDSGNTANGTNIQQWAHDPNNANQRFRLEPVSGQSNVYYIRNTNTNKMLDVSGGSYSNGANIHQWSFHGGANQQWRINSCVSLPPTATPTATNTPVPSATPTNTPSPTPTYTATPIPTASGGGTIWGDVNDDGMYESGSESGLANVQIEVYSSNQTPGQDTPLQTVTTDGSGNYQFANIPAGSYIFYIPNPPVDMPLSSTTTDTRDNDEDNDDNGIQENSGDPISSPPIYLYPGTEPDVDVDGDGPNSNLTIDFGLTSSGEIVGKAWSDLDRDGIQDGGEPSLPNAPVKLVEPGGNIVASTQTANNGTYTLPEVQVGEYSVQFETPGEGWWLTQKDQGSDDNADSDIDPQTGFSDSFMVTANGSKTVDSGFVQMQIGGYAWADANSDGLQDENESGIGGLTIQLISAGEWVQCANENEVCNFTGTATVRYGANGVYAYKSATNGIQCNNDSFGDPLHGVFKSCAYQDTSSENATIIATTSTDSDGTYVLDSRDVPEGLRPSTAYILRTALDQANLDGRMPTKVNVDNGETDADEVDSDAVRIDGNAVINFTTGASELTNYSHDFGFGSFAGSISGEAWNDLEGNGIQNTIIPNANGVPVSLYNSEGHLVASTETAGNGGYALQQLPPDDYVLEFEPPVATVWFTLKDQGIDETLDSDVNPNTGRTDVISVADSPHTSIDAGLIRGTLAYPPRLPNPGDQLSKLDASVALYLTAIDDQNSAITYSASNLPPGLTIGQSDGRITGAPSAVGIYNVTITATDGEGGVTTIAFTWTVEELPVITCASGVHEAEDGSLSGNFVRIVIPDGASQTQHIAVPNGMGSSWNGPNSSAAIYCFDVETAGRYRIVASGRPVNGQADSFFVTVDGTPSDGFLWDLPAPTSDYVSDYVNHRGNADPVEVMLSAGQHLVAFYLREDGTHLDTVELELVEEMTPAVTCGGMEQEAEAGVLNGNFLTYADQAASNGLYVAVANYRGDNFNGAYVPDRVDFCFDVPVAGLYTLEGTTLANHWRNNSFYVKVNGLPDRGYLWDIAIGPNYATDEMNNRYGSDPVVMYLDAGQNNISFYLREDGTKLDKVALVEANSVQAAGVSASNFVPESAGEEVNVIGTLEVPSDYQGEPALSDIRVKLEGQGFETETETNHAGKYYVDDVPPGEYTVTATVPDAEVEDGEKTLTQTVTVNAAITEETIVPDSAEDETRTVETSFEYQPPEDDSTNNGIYLPFMSIR